MKWARTCLECGHVQSDVKPEIAITEIDGYCDRPCEECESASLDYGREQEDADADRVHVA
jgi:predicted  nucleic acid-binding Zn-ribbon protein